ncbi:MAG: diguanylate cyclase [Planctomycetes bacterium]|nr:diguanylate cyclase [Planctomycetota bacterium]
MNAMDGPAKTVEVLLVEDNAGDVRLIVEALKSCQVPHRLHVATDGVDAMEFLTRAGKHAEAPRPDLVLLDLNLPRRHGREVLKEVKRDPNLRSIPILVLTTTTAEAEVRKVYELSANCCITKPVNLDQFRRVMKSLEEFWFRTANLPTPDDGQGGSTRLRVLVLEDSPVDSGRIRSALAKEPRSGQAADFEVTCVERLATGLEFLQAGDVDAVLLDLTLPDARGLEVVVQVHAKAPNVPILVLTAIEDEGLALQTLQAGAQDFLPKAGIEGGSLGRAIRYAVERQQSGAGQREVPLIDEMTGVFNRRGFFAVAEQYIKLARRTRSGLLLLFGDLDGFKGINDKHGHAEGDRALQETAKLLRQTFRGSDIIARLGGDEFVVLATETRGVSPETLLRRLEANLEASNTAGKRPYKLAMSVGFAACEVEGLTSIEDLLTRADQAMYEAKRRRRGL